MSLSTKKLAQPNHLLRQERHRRGWTLEEMASELHFLCEEDARTARGEINAKMIGSWERGEHTPSLYYRKKLCLLFGRSAEELGFVESLQPPEPRPAVLSEVPQGTSVQSTRHQTMDMLDASDAPYASLEQQTSTYLTDGVSDLALFVEAGWSVDDILDSLRIILPGVQAMRKITRREIWKLGAAAVMSDIPILTGRHISAEERAELHNALGESIAGGWKLFHTTGNAQVLAVGRAQLFLVQQNHALLYPSVQPLFYSGVYRLMGAALFFQEKYEEAHRAQSSAYAAALEGADTWNMAQSRTWQVYGYHARGQHIEAIQAIESALRLTVEHTDESSRRLRSHLLACWAENAAAIGETTTAYEKLDASAVLLEGISPNEEFDRMHWLQIAGNCAFAVRNYFVAIRYYEEALAELPPNWIMRYAVTALPLAAAYAKVGERDASLTVAKKAISLISTLNAPIVNRQLADYIQHDLLELFPGDSSVHTFVGDLRHRFPHLVPMVG
jgi:tetratricopeptide (TPR) repeat protein/transcriptional regulator with XRE-family HTH domain